MFKEQGSLTDTSWYMALSDQNKLSFWQTQWYPVIPFGKFENRNQLSKKDSEKQNHLKDSLLAKTFKN